MQGSEHRGLHHFPSGISEKIREKVDKDQGREMRARRERNCVSINYLMSEPAAATFSTTKELGFFLKKKTVILKGKHFFFNLMGE